MKDSPKPSPAPLSAEDKRIFATEAKKLNAIDLVRVIHELEMFKGRFTDNDWRFMTSHIGRRAERLLRNVAKNQSFED